jgi:hypothetical protein
MSVTCCLWFVAIKLIEYISLSPNRYKMLISIIFKTQLTTNNLSNEIHNGDSESYFIGTHNIH